MKNRELCCFLVLLCSIFGGSIQADIPKDVKFSDKTYTTQGLYHSGGGTFFNAEYYPQSQDHRTAAISLHFQQLRLASDRLDQLIDEQLRLLDTENPNSQDRLSVVKKTDKIVVLKSLKFKASAPLESLFRIWIFRSDGYWLESTLFEFKPRKPYNTADAFRKEIEKNEDAWLKSLYELDKGIHAEISKKLVELSKNQDKPTSGN